MKDRYEFELIRSRQFGPDIVLIRDLHRLMSEPTQRRPAFWLRDYTLPEAVELMRWLNQRERDRVAFAAWNRSGEIMPWR